MSFMRFCFIMLVCIAAVCLGIRLSRGLRKTIREDILKETSAYRPVIELVRQKKMYQAENMVMLMGRPRNKARMTAVTIRDMLKSGELR